MGVRIIYKDVDFSANKVPAEYQEVNYEALWSGYLCNYGSSDVAQQNSAWSTRIYKIPTGVDKVYITGQFAATASYGISLISAYNDTNHTYTNITGGKNVIAGGGDRTRAEIDLSNFTGANYILWCYVNQQASSLKVEVYM